MSIDTLVKHVSGEARCKIIDIMASSRSIRSLAALLDVSHSAIRKYIGRKAYPSDEVIVRAISSLEEYEKRQVMHILIDDIMEAVEELANEVMEYRDSEVMDYLASRLLSVLEKVGWSERGA